MRSTSVSFNGTGDGKVAIHIGICEEDFVAQLSMITFEDVRTLEFSRDCVDKDHGRLCAFLRQV